MVMRHRPQSERDIPRDRPLQWVMKQKQLDRFLLGLAKLYIVDPKEIAAKIIEEIKAMEESMDGPPINPEEAENGAQTQK